MSLYSPVYPPEGAPCRGFVCLYVEPKIHTAELIETPPANHIPGTILTKAVSLEELQLSYAIPCCGRLTRTQRGMRKHLEQRHGIKIQEDLFSHPEDRDASKDNRRIVF